MNRVLSNLIHNHPNVKWNFKNLSSHTHVYFQTLKDFENADWNYDTLVDHPNFSWHWVREFPEKPWNWRLLSSNRYFTWNWVREFPNKPWNWDKLSERGMSSIDILLEFPDKPWNWYSLTLSNEITIEDIMNHPNLPWTINELMFTFVDDEGIEFIRMFRSHYDRIAWIDHSAHTKWSLAKKHMDLPWVYAVLIMDEFNPVTDTHYLYELDWDFSYLSSVLDFEKVISKCPDIPWNYALVSKNPTVRYEHIALYPEIQWNLETIQLDSEIRRNRAASVIQRHWRRCVTDPSYEMCKKVLLKVLDEILPVKLHNDEN